MGSGWAFFHGRTRDNAEHAHHALQFVVFSRGEVRVWIDARGELRGPGVLIGPDIRHELAPIEQDLFLLYLDRETAAGRALARTCPIGYRVLGADERDAVISL